MATIDQSLASQHRLPVWWRRLLVTLATLLLCSCHAPRGPWIGAAQAASPAAPAAGNAQTTPDRQRWRRAAEVRSLEPEQLQASVPMPSAAPLQHCPHCSAASCQRGFQGDQANGSHCDTVDTAAGVGPGDEYLCDGGDFGLPVGVRADWTLDGLEQEDAVAHYDTLDGRVVVTPSNRTCVYAPRFAAVRRVERIDALVRQQLPDIEISDLELARADETQPVAASTQRHAVVVNRDDQPPILFRDRAQAGGLENVQAPAEEFNILPVYANHQVVRTGQVDGSQQAEVRRAVQAAVSWASDQAVQVVFENEQAVATLGLRQPGVVYQTSEPDSPRLRLLKLASTHHALPGEEVEFTLRFDNVGDQVVGNVTIVDNLTTRLEYVSDSAKSSVSANFSAVPNGTGSSVLRWEIEDPVQPGDGGILQFTARVL